MGRPIFISYRRDDTEGEAGRLFDDLVRAYGDNSVFMDVAGINPGTDFRRAIDENVSSCGVLLAMIGPAWATLTNNAGERRLDDANDFVRLEIAAALARNIAVIPVLVHDAKMPRQEQLPENLKDLAYRNSVEITHARWNSDVELLTKALGQYVTSSASTSSQPVHATVPVQLPAPNDRHAPSVEGSSRKALFGIVTGVVILLLAVGGYFLFRSPTESSATPPQAAAATSPTPAAASAAPLAGRWTNASPVERGGPTKLAITVNGNQIGMHAWGQCQPTDCDWGEQSAAFDGVKATASWKMTVKQNVERTATITTAPYAGGLHVTIVNTFSDRPKNQRQFDFVRAQ